MRQARGRGRRAVVIAGAVWAIWPRQICVAATLDWITPAGGNYSAASNWSTGVVPASGDTAQFDLAGSYAVSFTQPTTPISGGTNVNVDGGAVTLLTDGSART